MKQLITNLLAGAAWLILLLGTNLFFVFVTWLTAPAAFANIAVMLLLFTTLVVLLGYWIDHKKRKRQREAVEAILLDLDEEIEQTLLAAVDKSWHPVMQNVSAQLREQVKIIKEKQSELENYQEFIEGWTHEIKTPLSLATLVLENHKEEMSPYVYRCMEHVRHVISSDVEKILYYARLHADHVDYRFEKINLRGFLQECLDDFRTISDEKGIRLELQIIPLQIVSDKKVLAFMLSQLLSNAFKYTSSENGIVSIKAFEDTQEDKKTHLVIRDNGKGVPPEDLPFLFDKGFTGNHPDRKNATGMGLYLLKKYADALAIEVEIGAMSASGKGFEIELIFPFIN